MAERGRSKTSRRSFIGRTAATAGLAALGQTGVPALAKPGQPPVRQGQRRPNILIMMVDEQRYPTAYESSALAAFRSTYLPTQKTLAQSGVTFRRHYAASVACVPSRTSLLTGHYPSLHGCSQTDGAAKAAVEHDMFWLDATPSRPSATTPSRPATSRTGSASGTSRTATSSSPAPRPACRPTTPLVSATPTSKRCTSGPTGWAATASPAGSAGSRTATIPAIAATPPASTSRPARMSRAATLPSAARSWSSFSASNSGPKARRPG